MVTQPAQQAREVADGAVEVERVQGVEAGGDQGGGGALAVVQPDPAVLQGVLLDRGGLVRVAAQSGLVQDRVHRRDPVRPGGDSQVPVHERHRRGRELGGGPGDLAGLPCLQPPALHQRPQAWEPVAELHRLRHQRQARRVGQAERRRRAPRPRTPPASTPASGARSKKPGPSAGASPPVRWVGNDAAGRSGVTGCSSTQCTANAGRSASARSAARRRSTTASSTADASRSRTSGAASVSSSGVLVIRET